jgi:RimJ/RimL family protein N-acetyltransferase
VTFPGSLAFDAWRIGVRFHLRPLRRLVERSRPGAPPSRTWGVSLGPLAVGDRTVRLRSPRIADAPDWRRLRMANRERIEPWWTSSPLSWEQRHTDAEWVSHYLQARRDALAGDSLPLVVEVDGEFVGQCNLEWIDAYTGNAEMGIWLDAEIAGKGLSAVAAACLLDHTFDTLGLHRVTAPIAEGNELAAWGAQHMGMHREGLMVGYLDVGGARRAHHLWALTREDVPAGGMVATMLATAGRPRTPRHEARSDSA